MRGRIEGVVRECRRGNEKAVREIEGRRRIMEREIERVIEEVRSMCGYVREEMEKEMKERETLWKSRAVKMEKEVLSLLESSIKQMHCKGEEVQTRLNGVKNKSYVGVEGLMREIKKGGDWREVEEEVRRRELEVARWGEEKESSGDVRGRVMEMLGAKG